jgi:hypothetical protein
MSDATLLATAHLQVFASLHYPEASREWERLPPVLQTWASWQTKYREANVERLRLLRADPNSFGAANNVTDTQTTSDAITTTLDNSANSATNDSTLMSNMLAQLATLTTRLDGMQQYHGVVTPPANPTTPPPMALTTTPWVQRVGQWHYIQKWNFTQKVADNMDDTAIADTGASHHYCHGRAPTTTFTSNAPPTMVNIANGERIQSLGKPNSSSQICHQAPKTATS